jgi:hypothetical protein
MDKDRGGDDVVATGALCLPEGWHDFAAPVEAKVDLKRPNGEAIGHVALAWEAVPLTEKARKEGLSVASAEQPSLDQYFSCFCTCAIYQ